MQPPWSRSRRRLVACRCPAPAGPPSRSRGRLEASPDTGRAFPVSVQQWGQGPLEVNDIYATSKGEFPFIDACSARGLTVKLFDTRHALDMVNLMGHMGVVGNRTSLPDLAFGDSNILHPPASLPPSSQPRAGE